MIVRDTLEPFDSAIEELNRLFEDINPAGLHALLQVAQVGLPSEVVHAVDTEVGQQHNLVLITMQGLMRSWAKDRRLNGILEGVSALQFYFALFFGQRAAVA